MLIDWHAVSRGNGDDDAASSRLQDRLRRLDLPDKGPRGWDQHWLMIRCGDMVADGPTMVDAYARPFGLHPKNGGQGGFGAIVMGCNNRAARYCRPITSMGMPNETIRTISWWVSNGLDRQKTVQNQRANAKY